MDLLVDVTGGVGTITLHRPEVRNALSPELVESIEEAVRELDARDDVAAMVLTGADPAFCAGVDLRRLSSEPVDAERLAQPVPHLGFLPPHDTPVIGAVNGAAVTGGLELALGCDFLIASERARFADTHARVGAMPGGGLTIRLPQLIGIDRARQMSLTGDFIDARRAYEWGLVSEVVAHADLLPRARALGEAIASIPAANITEVRRMYAAVGGGAEEAAGHEEARRARQWMVRRFDQARLATERESIEARGRAQA
jgi:enoyl-CoA hydratase